MIQFQYAPYAGIAYLNSAACSSGHEFILHMGSDVQNIVHKINLVKPDIIGFSTMSPFYKETLSIASQIKNTFDIPTILGGPHPTLFPEIINDACVDIICRGEGEFALIELLNALRDKNPYYDIKNLWVKHNGNVYKNELRPLTDPLDQIPLVDWSCYKSTSIANSPPIAFLIRGCPYSCTYCFNASMRELYKGKGKYLRQFSVGRSILEIKEALKVFNHSPVLFTSDSFGIDLEWTDALFTEYSKITDLQFVLLIRPELATEECVRLLARHGCRSVALGVESGSERVRKEIMHRNYPNKLLMDVADRLHRHGIEFRTYNMLGLPSETEEELWETIDINIRMKTDYPRATIFTPMPNTKIVEIAKELGYLNMDFSFESIPDSVFSGTILKKLDNDKTLNSLYFFQTLIIFPKIRGFIKFLMRFKPNIFYKLWFYLVYAHLHKKLEQRKLIPYIRYLISNINHI